VYNGTQRFATRQNNDPRLDRLRGQLFPSVDPVEGTMQLEPGTPAYREAANQFAELQNSDELSTSNFLEDADFLKIREIAVAYDLAGLASQFVDTGLPVREFRVRLSGRNLFTFTDYSGPDPEVNQTGARTITQGTDFLTLQTPRTFTASVSVGF